MEGPAFSTKAESNLYRSWGMDVIGMTNLQEAKLAREAEICYVTIAMVTDYDCWHEEHDAVEVTDIIRVLQQNAANACQRGCRRREDDAGGAEMQVRFGSAARVDHRSKRSCRSPPSEAGTDCRQVFRVAKRWRPSGAGNGSPEESCARWAKSSRANSSAMIVESLADSFDPAQAAAYEELMRAWIPATPRVLPAIPGRVETVYVLSRVTLGADIKITSIILDAMKKRLPSRVDQCSSRIENPSRFSRADSRVWHMDAEYPRSGPVSQRIEFAHELAKPDRGAKPHRRRSRLAHDATRPGSGLRSRSDYFHFPSRIANAAANLTESDPELAGRRVRRIRQSVHRACGLSPWKGDRPRAAVSLGVGETNPNVLAVISKPSLIRALGEKYQTIWIDRGVGGEEARRVTAAAESFGMPGPRPLLGRFVRRIRFDHLAVRFLCRIRFRRPACRRGRRYPADLDTSPAQPRNAFASAGVRRDRAAST